MNGSVELIPIHLQSKDKRFEIRCVETMGGVRWLAIDRTTGKKHNCSSLSEARLHVKAMAMTATTSPDTEDA